MEEWRNGGMEEWRNGGMEEWRNGGMEEWRLGEKAGGTEAPWQKVWQAASRVVLAACGSLWESVGGGARESQGAPRGLQGGRPQGAPGSPREPQGAAGDPQGAPGSPREGG